MWACFKEELEDRISQFVPKTKKNLTTFKKDAWKRPLNSTLLPKISKKNRMWTRYMETRDVSTYKNIKQCVIQSEMQHVN